ncbi:hypothetical protein AJ80_00389 [Polytolypa hystricis UAMH7299]|uniref:Uncharacterized protein n=1 Tax=Polytolypa hystricis (strain UAMH7299) TaxID=1447883 RepID=A0A2B7Z3L3_POLH7|nr:hypothetical protein AJ80_00389 [Polytolypa hystricis UAMH7299]
METETPFKKLSEVEWMVKRIAWGGIGYLGRHGAPWSKELRCIGIRDPERSPVILVASAWGILASLRLRWPGNEDQVLSKTEDDWNEMKKTAREEVKRVADKYNEHKEYFLSPENTMILLMCHITDEMDQIVNTITEEMRM